jgi:crotonobetainyl-CoA:carnitine CoA-transferase CaiB-like acyl-CoA transferase
LIGPQQPDLNPRRAPHVGEHNDEVLRAADYTDAEIEGLRAEGIIG